MEQAAKPHPTFLDIVFMSLVLYIECTIFWFKIEHICMCTEGFYDVMLCNIVHLETQ